MTTTNPEETPMTYRHKATGALATIAGPAHGTDGRGPRIGVVWHDRYNTTGAFTRAEFDAEFEEAPDA